jgi:antirestriction protein ArdC
MACQLALWTGHPARLNRSFVQSFGEDGYALEVLAAELGSALLRTDLGLNPDAREERNPCLRRQAKAIRADWRVLFNAAAQGQRAADY